MSVDVENSEPEHTQNSYKSHYTGAEPLHVCVQETYLHWREDNVSKGCTNEIRAVKELRRRRLAAGQPSSADQMPTGTQLAIQRWLKDQVAKEMGTEPLHV